MNKLFYLLLMTAPSLLSSCMLHNEYKDDQKDDASSASVQQETIQKAHQKGSSTKHTSHVVHLGKSGKPGKPGKPGRDGFLFGERGEDGGAGEPAQVEER